MKLRELQPVMEPAAAAVLDAIGYERGVRAFRLALIRVALKQSKTQVAAAAKLHISPNHLNRELKKCRPNSDVDNIAEMEI